MILGALGIAAAVGVGAVAHFREAGFGVAPVLASKLLHFRASILLFGGCLAPLVSVLWAKLSSDAEAIARMQQYLVATLVLCLAIPPVLLAINYAMVMGVLSDHFALLPALMMLAAAILYAVIMHPLSGITGVGLSSRVLMRTSALWLTVTAALQLLWMSARIFGDVPDMLWYIERPAIEIALLGFAIPAALTALVACSSNMYHSRDMTRVVLRTHYPLNGLVVMWTLVGMWTLRFPGGYQNLAAPVIGIGLFVVLLVIAMGSGLLVWRSVWGVRSEQSSEGPWALRIGSMVMMLLIAEGLLVAVDGTARAALSSQPLPPLLTAQTVITGLGIVPLAVAASLAALRPSMDLIFGTGVALIAAGAAAALLMRPVEGIVERSIAGLATGAEILIVLGAVLIALTAQRITVARRA